MSFQGLPPLPKSLSAYLENSTRENGSPNDMPGPRTSRIASRTPPRHPPPPPPVRRSPSNSSLETKIAMLRKSMLELRQQDMSLVNKLLALQDSIQEVKYMFDRSISDLDLSPPGAASNPISGSWDSLQNQDQSEDFYRYLQRLGYGSPALMPRGLDSVQENENDSSSLSSSQSSVDLVNS